MFSLFLIESISEMLRKNYVDLMDKQIRKLKRVFGDLDVSYSV